MKNVSVISAEWNPSNGGQVLITVADNEGGAFVKSTAKKVVLNGISEKDANDTTVIAALKDQDLNVVNRFNVD